MGEGGPALINQCNESILLKELIFLGGGACPRYLVLCIHVILVWNDIQLKHNIQSPKVCLLFFGNKAIRNVSTNSIKGVAVRLK